MQVLEMENQVLKHFSFQIYTPTPKTFLRRFLRAAQASRLVCISQFAPLSLLITKFSRKTENVSIFDC